MVSDSFRSNNHHEGFEIEDHLIQLFKESKFNQWKDFKNANPELFENRFQRKPCIRQLRYVRQDSSSPDGSFFVHGEIYCSTDFNGSTYSIEGYSDVEAGRVIGCNYFEILENQS